MVVRRVGFMSFLYYYLFQLPMQSKMIAHTYKVTLVNVYSLVHWQNSLYVHLFCPNIIQSENST